MPSVSEILLQHGRDVANAAATRGAARAQLAQSLGAIPGQVINNYQQMTQFADARKAEATQQQIRESQATTAQVGARAATTNERDLNTYKDIVGKLPKVNENGLQLTDVEALNRELTAARIDPAPYVQHAQAMNTAFRAEFAAKQALAKTAVDAVRRAGNNPVLADKTLDDMVAAGSLKADDAEKYKAFYTTGDDGQPLPFAERVARVGQLTNYLGNPRESIVVGPGAQLQEKDTGNPLGPAVPANVTQATLAAAAAKGDPIALAAVKLLKGNESNPTAASLALKAAQGDEQAIKALAVLRAQQPPQQPSQDIVQVMGPNGVPIWVRKGDAVGQPAAQAPRAVTGAERQVLAYYNRAKDAVDTLTTPREGGDSLEQKIAKAGLMSQGRLQIAPNFLQSQDNQSYRQAQRAFTEARLRKESGAAIPTAEYENDAKTYFAQPGDDAKIVEQKRAARQTVLDGLKFSAGKAYEEFYGEPNVSPARAAGTIRAKDPQGNIHEAPAGTKLPDGWVLQ